MGRISMLVLMIVGGCTQGLAQPKNPITRVTQFVAQPPDDRVAVQRDLAPLRIHALAQERGVTALIECPDGSSIFLDAGSDFPSDRFLDALEYLFPLLERRITSATPDLSVVWVETFIEVVVLPRMLAPDWLVSPLLFDGSANIGEILVSDLSSLTPPVKTWIADQQQQGAKLTVLDGEAELDCGVAQVTLSGFDSGSHDLIVTLEHGNFDAVILASPRTPSFEPGPQRRGLDLAISAELPPPSPNDSDLTSTLQLDASTSTAIVVESRGVRYSVTQVLGSDGSSSTQRAHPHGHRGR